MAHLGDYIPGFNVHGKFSTVRPSTGAPYTLAGTPSLRVYKNADVNESISGVSLTVDFDGVTGLNHFSVNTAANVSFYTSNANFDVVIGAGTVDSVSVVGQTVASFRLVEAEVDPITDTTDSSRDGSFWGDFPINANNVVGMFTARDLTDIPIETRLLYSSPGWSGYTLRQTFEIYGLKVPTFAPTHIRLAIRSSNTEGMDLSTCYVGHQTANISGDYYDFANTPVQVTFSGSNSVSIPANTRVLSDWVSFNWDRANGIVVSMFISGANDAIAASGPLDIPGALAFYKNANDPTTVDASGYTRDTAGDLQAVEGIEVMTPLSASDIRVYKNTDANQKATTNGITVTSPFDTTPGMHAIKIDTSNTTGDVGFWSPGSVYNVMLDLASKHVVGFGVPTVIGRFTLGMATTAVWDADISTGYSNPDAGYVLNETLGSLGSMKNAVVMLEGTLQAANSTTATLPSSATGDNDAYVGHNLFIHSSTGAKQIRKITAYNGSTKVATVSPAWSVTPANTSYCYVLPGEAAFAPTQKTEINAEIVDTLAADSYGEPGQGAPPSTTNLANKISFIYKAMRNKVTQTSNTFSLFADDGTTVDQKATVSDDGTTFTRGKLDSGA